MFVFFWGGGCSDEDESAFLQAGLKLWIPRQPNQTISEPFDERITTEGRKFVIQGIILPRS